MYYAQSKHYLMVFGKNLLDRVLKGFASDLVYLF